MKLEPITNCRNNNVHMFLDLENLETKYSTYFDNQ